MIGLPAYQPRQASLARLSPAWSSAVELDTDEARDRAARWVAEAAIASFEFEATDGQIALVCKRGVLDCEERKALYRWVAREVRDACQRVRAGLAAFPLSAREVDEIARDRNNLAEFIGCRLGLPSSDARKLCDAAVERCGGWP